MRKPSDPAERRDDEPEALRHLRALIEGEASMEDIARAEDFLRRVDAERGNAVTKAAGAVA